MTELLPCPFCGAKEPVRLVRIPRDGVQFWRDRYVVRCDYADGGCGAEGGYRTTDMEAMEVWNERKGEVGQCQVGDSAGNYCGGDCDRVDSWVRDAASDCSVLGGADGEECGGLDRETVIPTLGQVIDSIKACYYGKECDCDNCIEAKPECRMDLAMMAVLYLEKYHGLLKRLESELK